MSMNPNKLDFQRQTDFIPVTKFSGLADAPTIVVPGGNAPDTDTGIGLLADANGTTLTKESADEKVGIVGVQPPRSMGAANPVMKEISTIGLSGLLMVTAGDDVHHFMRVPPYWDREHPLYIRAVWTSDAAAVGNRTVTWKMLLIMMVGGTSAMGPGAAPLTTPIVAQAPKGVVRTLQITANGIFARSSIAGTATHMAFLMEMQAFHVDFSEDKFLLGVEFEYTPRFGRGQNRYEAPVWEAA